MIVAQDNGTLKAFQITRKLSWFKKVSIKTSTLIKPVSIVKIDSIGKRYKVCHIFWLALYIPQ